MTSPTSPDRRIDWADPARQQAFESWLAGLANAHRLRVETLEPASADASFRRYFRVQADGGSLIVMDAPPPQEDVRPFVQVAQRLIEAGLNAPRILAVDEPRGFVLMADLGRRLYLDAVREASTADADRLMRDALRALVQLQCRVPVAGLPAYDAAAMAADLDLFPRWCVQEAFGQSWSTAQQAAWQRVCRSLIDSAQAQAQVAMHGDWMPRNLMVCEPNPGVLDFQDAMCGPLTYDLASMLRDAFWSWDEDREIDWAVRYWEAARAAGLDVAQDFGEFWRQVEWMGLHRHLRVLGIFCRLKHRDGKPAYAADLPRFFGYANKVALRYRELNPLLPLLEPLSGQAVQAAYTF